MEVIELNVQCAVFRQKFNHIKSDYISWTEILPGADFDTVFVKKIETLFGINRDNVMF